MATSYAMDAASNMHSCLYRSGYDISLPLFPKRDFHELADIPPTDRKFFLTTKVRKEELVQQLSRYHYFSHRSRAQCFGPRNPRNQRLGFGGRRRPRTSNKRPRASFNSAK